MATVGTVFKSTNPSGKTVWKVEVTVGKRSEGSSPHLGIRGSWGLFSCNSPTGSVVHNGG
jgi:hypothetical protein